MLRAIASFFSSPAPLVQVETIRHVDGGAAIVFLHGFSATTRTWGQFPFLLAEEKRLQNWSIFSVSYASTKSVDVPFWSADPDLTLLANNLITLFEGEPLTQFSSIALLAHSMGGLIAQKASLEGYFAKRLDHLLLFGVPSLGISKARLLSKFKRQIRDMSPRSKFITSLRNEWRLRFASTRSFRLSVFHGANDVFISTESNFEPFSARETKVINGDHLTMILPESREQTGFMVVVDALLGNELTRDAVDSAEAAVERGEFRALIDGLYPPKDQLESSVAVNVALALDALGRNAEAINLLEATSSSAPDAIGTLAGRYKRKWLTGGSLQDWNRATDLYEKAYADSAETGNMDQAMYHAINLAFLYALSIPRNAPITGACRRYASEALSLAEQCADNHWSRATKGEAQLILGNIDEARNCYRAAKELAPSPREVGSMYTQALYLANHFLKGSRRDSIINVFQVDP